MIRFKIYRMIRVLFSGARSFTKGKHNYALIKESSSKYSDLVKFFNERGWVEEWPLPNKDTN